MWDEKAIILIKQNVLIYIYEKILWKGNIGGNKTQKDS